jgi:hypothetical protein
VISVFQDDGDSRIVEQWQLFSKPRYYYQYRLKGKDLPYFLGIQCPEQTVQCHNMIKVLDKLNSRKKGWRLYPTRRESFDVLVRSSDYIYLRGPSHQATRKLKKEAVSQVGLDQGWRIRYPDKK